MPLFDPMSTKTRYTISRPNDYAYDPNYIVSGPKDYARAAMVANAQNSELVPVVVFRNMFSELRNYPSQRFALLKNYGIPDCFENQARAHMPDPFLHKKLKMTKKGTLQLNPAAYYIRAKVPSTPYSPSSDPYFSDADSKKGKNGRSEASYIRMSVSSGSSRMHMVTRETQTMYRDSEVQTIPWEPEYRKLSGLITEDQMPEVLKLQFLKWGEGLPAGVRELEIIERSRRKCAWQKIVPYALDAATLELSRNITEALETEAWIFREKEIDDIQSLRLELLEKMIEEVLGNSKQRADMILMRRYTQKKQETDDKILRLRNKAAREMRKLRARHLGINHKYHKVNIVDELANFSSELYAPMMRHGVDPKRFHEKISFPKHGYTAMLAGIDNCSTLPRDLETARIIKDNSIKLPGTRLCPRETRWTHPVLKQLHEELKNLRKAAKVPCRLRVRKVEEQKRPETPSMESIDDTDEDVFQARVIVQKVIRGRASQIMVFEGRDKCRELITELRSTHALQASEKDIKNQQRIDVMMQQREKEFQTHTVNRVKEALAFLQGGVVGTLLDFLNKELRRLLDERRMHAVALLAQRERTRREAAEAGRRQTEERRRLEHDEMFKQVVKVHQDTIDMYLQDIINEGIDKIAQEEAQAYVEKLAAETNAIIDAEEEMSQSFHGNEDMVADLIHHFLLPDVEKKIMREKIVEKQKKYLKAAYDILEDKFDTLKPSKEALTETDKLSKDLEDAASSSGTSGLQGEGGPTVFSHEVLSNTGLKTYISTLEAPHVDSISPKSGVEEEDEIEVDLDKLSIDSNEIEGESDSEHREVPAEESDEEAGEEWGAESLNLDMEDEVEQDEEQYDEGAEDEESFQKEMEEDLQNLMRKAAKELEGKEELEEGSIFSEEIMKIDMDYGRQEDLLSSKKSDDEEETGEHEDTPTARETDEYSLSRSIKSDKIPEDFQEDSTMAKRTAEDSPSGSLQSEKKPQEEDEEGSEMAEETEEGSFKDFLESGIKSEKDEDRKDKGSTDTGSSIT